MMVVCPVTLIAQPILPSSGDEPWYMSGWIYGFISIAILYILYSIRRYEKRRQVNKFREERNQYLEGILHNAPFAIALADNQGRLTLVNSIFETIFGYSREEVLGRTLDFLQPGPSVHTGTGKEQHADHLINYAAGKRKRKDGRPVEVEIFAAPNLSGDKQLGYLVFYNDISQRLKAESDLKKTRREYLEILDNLQDGYMEANNEGIITYMNLPLMKELGFDDREEVIGKHFWDFTQKEFARGVANKFSAIFETGRPLEYFKTKYSGKNGKTFVGEAAISPVIDEGEVVGTKGTIRNITLRLESEKEIAYQKDFLDALLQQAPIAIVIINKENRISHVNPAFQKLFGYDQDEVIGKDPDQFLYTPEILKQMSEQSENRLVESLYITGKCKKQGGTLTDVEVFLQPFFAGSINYGHLVFYNDISERLKAEAELEDTTTAHRAVLDTLQDSYFEADSAGYLTYVNQRFVEATKYKSKQELIGRHFRHLVARDSRLSFVKEFKKLYATNMPIRPLDLLYLTKDGAEFSSEIVASPILENGIAVGARGIIRDISIRVKAEEILKNAKEAAELRAGELTSINHFAERVSYSLNLQDTLETVCKELTKIFPIQSAGIALLGGIKPRLEVMAFHAIRHAEGKQQGKILELEGNAEVQHVIDAKRIVVIRDVQRDLKAKPILELLCHVDSRALMIVPLVTRGRAIGIIGMPIAESEQEFTRNNIQLAETLASQIATAVDNAQLHAQTEQARDVAERDLEIGSEIQLGFFPLFLPEIPGWEISTYFKAARQVSGDFYDVFPIHGTKYLGMVVADVCDKGVGAALFMVLLRSLIRSSSEQYQQETLVEDMLSKMACSVNGYIVNNHGQSNMFATLVLSILDPVANRLYYVNGGHEAPLLVDAGGHIKKELEPTGPAFGFSTELSFDLGVIDFMPGDLLLSFTDGFAEARDPGGRFYTDERLLKEASSEWPSTFSAVKHFEADVFSHIGGQMQLDDLTLVALRKRVEDEVVCHRFTRKAELQNLSMFRNFVGEACLLLKLEEEVIESLKLAIDEACSNLILHGYKDMEPGYIHISIKDLKGEILIDVEDTGLPFNPAFLDPPELSDDINERKIGGLGVFILKEMMDEINYESKDGRNCLSLKMRV